MFPCEPSRSLPQEGVYFTVSNDGDPGRGYAWAWVNGRIDLAVDVRLNAEPDGRFIIPLLELLRPATLMANAVSGPGYAKVYGKTRTRQRRRFDWCIAVSMYFKHPDGATKEWDDIDFPGQRPARSGTGNHTFCPVGGYAADKLRSWRAASPVEDLLASFLYDFLTQNGYHNVDSTIDETLTAQSKQNAPTSE